MHTVPFRLNKPAHIFQAGESTGFGIRTGIKCQDPKTKQDSWTNYEAVVFAKSPAQIEFYTANLIEGAMAVVSGEKLIVREFQGNNGPVITLGLLNANIEAIHTGRAPDAAQQAYSQGMQRPQQQPQGQPDQQGQGQGGFDEWDSEIPFMRLGREYNF